MLYLQLNCIMKVKRVSIVISILVFAGLSSAVQAQSDTVKLKEVGVHGKAAPAGSGSVTTTLNSVQLESTKGSSLGDVIKGIAGISVLRSGATISKPVIHGLHSNRILILNNGIRLEGQAWGAEHAPEIDPLIAERIHVIKGAESVRFGAEAIGGVVMVVPPDLPVSPAIHGQLNAIGTSNGRGITSSAMFSGGLNGLPGFGWRVQGSHKYAGNVKTADYYLGNTGLRELNYSAALGYVTHKSSYELYYSQFSTTPGVLYSAHAGTVEDIQARILAGKPAESYGFTYDITAPKQSISHHLAKVKAHYHLADQLSLDLVYGFQKNLRKEFDFRRGNREALPITDLVLNTHSFDAELKQGTDSNSTRSIGINGMFQVNNNIPGTLANTFIPNYDAFTGGIFLIQKWIKRTFELEAGVRYDFKMFDAAGFRYLYEENGPTEEYYGGQNQFHNFTGSFGVQYRLGHQWRLSGNLGLAWRAPSANELYSNGLHHGAGLYEIGDVGLKSEKGYKWITALKYISSSFFAELDVYAQWMENYIYSRPDLTYKQTVSGTYPVFRYGQTNASFFGFDLSANYRILPMLSYKVNAAIVRARDLSSDRYLPFIPSDRVDHHLKLDLKVTALEDAFLQFGHSFVARQDRYEVGSDYTAPPSAYHLFSIGAGANHRIGKQQLGMNLSVENLFNASYKDYMNRYRYYAHDMGRNISLRFAYKF